MITLNYWTRNPSILVDELSKVRPVSTANTRIPFLTKLYREYLESEDSPAFILGAAQNYTVATLENLAQRGGRMERRAAVLALGFLGHSSSSACLSMALRDADRGVRFLADNALRSLWCRDGSDCQRQALRTVIRLISSLQFDVALEHSTRLISDAPHFAEAWNQRAIVQYHRQRFDDSMKDCRTVLTLNPLHFGAAAGMGQCQLELGQPDLALKSFRRALKLNPSLEGVRATISSLQRSKEDI